MAEFELAIKYRTLPARLGLWLMGASMPLWSIVIPFCLGLFVAGVMREPEKVSPLMQAMIIFILSGIPLTAIFLSAICEDDRILITKEGMSFPLSMLGSA